MSKKQDIRITGLITEETEKKLDKYLEQNQELKKLKEIGRLIDYALLYKEKEKNEKLSQIKN